MRIAILLADTASHIYAGRFPSEAERIADLLRPERPGWTYRQFRIVEGDWPGADWDGVVISGSPASANDPDPWIAMLKARIRGWAASGTPLLGICFGHQVIAAALGGTVAHRGWIFGTAPLAIEARRPWMVPSRADFTLPACNEDQVTALPPGAARLGGSPACPNALVEYGPRALGVQFHPEMTLDFARALLADYAETFGPAVVARAGPLIEAGHEGPAIAPWLCRFLEAA
jgi:GMP synthase-like glutamine amidotransferase